jgi:endoglucanase
MSTRRHHLQTLLALGAAPLAPAARAEPGMRDLSSLQLARLMGTGWNLGNSLEATGGETAWGNPATTQALLDAVKAAGFGTVRIPVAWKQYADANDVISPRWMARVAEVVGYAKQAGLFTMINLHWDGGWMQPTRARQAEANRRITRFWTQIGRHFEGHDDTLLFAGTNEVMVEGDYGPPQPEYVEVQNGFNQTFVDAVRATGGANAVRHLIVQGFNTNIDHTVAHAVMPRDPARDRLMMEVHYYDPYEFTLDEKSKFWQWGAGTQDRQAAAPWGDEAHAERQFAKMKRHFIDRGIPVILGEFGAIRRTDRPGSEAYRIAWNRHIARTARAQGLVPVYWDNGVTGQHGMGLFDRRTGAQAFPELIRAIVSG